MAAKPIKASSRTLADIEGEIAAHENRRAEAARELDHLREQRPAMLLDLSDGADDRMDEIDRKISRAERIAPRAEAAIAVLQSELAAAEEAEEESRCEAVYAEGIKARAEYEKLGTEYNKAAAAVSAVLHKMKALRSTIEHANGNRPRRAMREGKLITAFDGVYPVADRVSLPGMLGEPDAWTAAKEVEGPYQRDSDRILVR